MVKHLPWLEILIVRAVVGNPSLRFADLKRMFAADWREEEVADAVCYLVGRGLIRLGRVGFTAFN